jgi:hypothetical protein
MATPSMASSLPQQITTKNDEKRKILLEAYNALISKQPVTEQQKLYFELTNLKIEKTKTIETLRKIIDTLQPMDDETETNPIIKAKNIILWESKSKKVQISDSPKWVENIKNALLHIIQDPDFCNLFAPYLNDYNIDSLLSNTGTGSTRGHKRKDSDCEYRLTFKARHTNLEKLKKYIEEVCLNNADLNYFRNLCEAFSVDLVDFESKCPDIIQHCDSLKKRLEEAQEKLDAELLEFLKLRIPTRLGLKQKIQQQSKSTTSRALLKSVSQEADEF